MQLRGNIETLEEQLQKTKEFFVETNMTNVQAIKDEQEVKEKEFEDKLRKDQAGVEDKVDALNGNIEALNKKVATLGKEKEKLKAELEKSVKVSFTTINEIKADLVAENHTEVEVLKKEVEESIKQNAEKVVEAEAHVINLRELNKKLLDQVKAQMADHGEAQEVMVAGLRNSNQQFLVSFQQEVEKEMERIKGELENNEEDMKKKGEDMTTMAGMLDDITKEAARLGAQVIGLEAREEAVEVQTGSVADDAKLNANQIFELSQTIASLDGRHVETVERMKEVAVMVSQFENQAKEIGQAFKEDQRKELKSIEGQLNTIYAEYEKMEKHLSDMKKENGEKDLKSTIEQLSEKQVEMEQQNAAQLEGLNRTEDKIGKIIETAGTLMVSDATKTEKINSLEKVLGGLENKFSDLESADLFLQESQKQLVERTSLVEGHGKRMEESLMTQVEEQQREVEEKLKVQVAALLKDVGELYTGQETLGEHVEKMQEDEVEKLMRLDAVEAGLPLLKSQMDELSGQQLDERVKSLEEETRSLAGGLVSLQFQAEKEEAVQTLASRMDRIDEVGCRDGATLMILRSASRVRLGLQTSSRGWLKRTQSSLEHCR